MILNKFLPIAMLGNPILREYAEIINNIDHNIRKLADNMLYSLERVNGVGLAGPQVYSSLNIFIIASKPNKRYPNAPLMAPEVVINPIIVSYSADMNSDWEGCLSIPGIRGFVPRSKEIEVQYTNIHGEKFEKTLSDFPARIFQHEFDHLEGKVYLDRLQSTKDIISEIEFQKMLEGM